MDTQIMTTVPLFRREVLERRADRLEGEISLAIPILWQTIGILLLAIVTATATFLCSASYARVENVGGEIELDRGVAPIVASRAGIVTAIHVQEGRMVHANEPLLEIQAEEHMSSSKTVSQNVLAALASQEQSLALQSVQVTNAAEAEKVRTIAQISGMQLELRSLDNQLLIQRDLIKRAESDLKQGHDLVRDGLISQRDVDQREENLLNKKQQLSVLMGERAVKETALADTRLSMRQKDAQTAGQLASLQTNHFELAQHQVDAEANRGYTLTAPVSGKVSAITLHVGQFVSTQQTIMALVPENGGLHATLSVPSRAAGFLSVGQIVHLAIDAYPYEKFGTVEGRVMRISTTTVEKSSAGHLEPVYLVTVHPTHQYINAFGHQQFLHSGMALSAHIITQKQSLLEWLFQPFYAVRNR